jgi:hypothetical protein
MNAFRAFSIGSGQRQDTWQRRVAVVTRVENSRALSPHDQRLDRVGAREIARLRARLRNLLHLVSLRLSATKNSGPWARWQALFDATAEARKTAIKTGACTRPLA